MNIEREIKAAFDRDEQGWNLGTIIASKSDMDKWGRDADKALAKALTLTNRIGLGDCTRTGSAFAGYTFTAKDGRFTEITKGNALRVIQHGAKGLRWF
jgi:hypothetical protein